MTTCTGTNTAGRGIQFRIGNPLFLVLMLCISVSDISAQGAEYWKTVYVKPAGASSGGGAGSSGQPFLLKDGNEYDFNRLLRPDLDRGVNTEVIFLDGTYLDVRLQVIKQVVGADVISLQDPAGDPTMDSRGRPSYRKPVYRLRSRCNYLGDNCRVPADDYTMGASSRAKLVLRASNPGKAKFISRKFRNPHKNIPAFALYIAGANFSSDKDLSFSNLKSGRIANLLVKGLEFSNYIDGIAIEYAENVVVEDCRFLETGSRDLSGSPDEVIGTVVLRAAANSRMVLFQRNLVQNSWNSIRRDLVGKVDSYPIHMIHPIYQQYAGDIVYRQNQIVNASSALVKFGYYPIVDAQGRITSSYSGSYVDRRTFLVGNRFIQDIAFLRYGYQTVYNPFFSLIHDNSMAQGSFSRRTTSMKGVVITGNLFQMVRDPLLRHASFLRFELPLGSTNPNPERWLVEGNRIVGIPAAQLAVQRIRGSAIDSYSSYKPQSAGEEFSLVRQVEAKIAEPQTASRAARHFLDRSLASADPARDLSLKNMIEHGIVVGVNTR